MEDQSNQTTQNEKEDLLPGYQNFEQFTKEGYKILMEAIRNSNSLPSGRDWEYYSTFESFNKINNEEGNKIQKLINRLLQHNQIEGNIRNRGMTEKIELMIDANDTILEKVANNIDEMNGIRKTVNEPVILQTVTAQLPVNGSWNRINSATFSINSSTSLEPSNSTSKSIRLLTAKNIVRPQTFFKDKINNNSNYPWEPRIKDKPNSLKPLAIFLEESENGQEFSHPYEFELDRFSPTSEQLQKEKPIIPPNVEQTPLIEVTKPEQIDHLINALMKCKAFAVDVEHHSYRSFMGITCLLQISTPDTDFIIDTLLLRDKLHLLNEVFTKPTIVKVFHGAEMDIQWLQRDLSIYVVNMFDTHQAAKQLELPALSLAYLMKRYCNFVPNKKFQLADWRIRPLPDELKMYAREDTHYLLYIYQVMKNELLKKANGQDNILRSIITKSTNICKMRYFKPVLREDSYMDFYRKCKRLFDNKQLFALKELYQWRDELSRNEDESTGYILPNHMLLQISESLPREMQGILACCNPIPPLVRANLLELHKIILKARDQPLEKPIFKEDIRARGSTKKISKINVDSPLHCPHDLSRTSEFRDDLPTLLGNTMESMTNILVRTSSIEKEFPSDSIFDSPAKNEKISEIQQKLQKIAFLGPYERYKLVKPFIQQEERRLEAEKTKADTDDKTQNKGTEVQGNNLETNEPTIEERIESIREHFLKLSRQTVEVSAKLPEKSLVQMGGKKKRKREPSVPDEEDTVSPDLTTTIPKVATPNFNKKKKKNNIVNMNNKRNFCAMWDEQMKNVNEKKRKRKNKNKFQ